ncbi:MAG: hypothetical protein AAGF79_15915 [Pseudomonadota bacterium]
MHISEINIGALMAIGALLILIYCVAFLSARRIRAARAASGQDRLIPRASKARRTDTPNK